MNIFSKVNTLDENKINNTEENIFKNILKIF